MADSSLNQSTISYRFPTDYIHCCLSEYVYNDITIEQPDVKQKGEPTEKTIETPVCIKKGERVQHEGCEDFKVEEIYEEESISYLSVLFLNEKKKQLVLAHRGIELSKSSFLIDDNNSLETQINGILVKALVPVMEKCYEITKRVIEKVDEMEKNSKGKVYLSFTGFSHGAWLSEYSIYYAHSNGYRKAKAVLFDSPGIFAKKSDPDSNIINDETTIKLTDFNVVNYLTAPSFTNSSGIHIGKCYRIFPKNEKEKKKKLAIIKEVFDKIPCFGIFGQSILESIQDYKFFINGLYSMMNHDLLTDIKNEFNKNTGKPDYLERVINFPIINFVRNKNEFDSFLEDSIDSTVSDIIEKIPIPSFMQNLSKYGLKTLAKIIIDKSLKKVLPGTHLLINAFFALKNKKEIFANLDKETFYLRLDEITKFNLEEQKKKEIQKTWCCCVCKEASVFASDTNNIEFGMKFEDKYETSNYYTLVDSLTIHTSIKNTDWCLDELHKLSLDKLGFNPFKSSQVSKEIWEKLMKIKSWFKTDPDESRGADKEYRVIKSLNKNININDIRESIE